MYKKVVLICGFLAGLNANEEPVTIEKHGLTYKILDSTNHMYDLKGPIESGILKADSVADLEDVEFLNIAGVHLQEIQPGAFRNLPEIKYIQIAFNDELTEIKSGVFNVVPSLTKVDVNNNGVTKIDKDAFDNMQNLKEVALDRNKIRQWDPEWFSNTPKLYQVTFNGNPIEELPANAFKNFQKEEDLYISFAHCKLKKIDDDAFKGVKIGHLSLDGNQIESVNGNFLQGVVEIDQLNLDGNKIRHVAEEDFDKVFKAKTTNLEGNPLEDDTVKKIKAWAKSHPEKTILF